METTTDVEERTQESGLPANRDERLASAVPEPRSRLRGKVNHYRSTFLKGFLSDRATAGDSSNKALIVSVPCHFTININMYNCM